VIRLVYSFRIDSFIFLNVAVVVTAANGVVIAGGSCGWIRFFCFQWANGFDHREIFF